MITPTLEKGNILPGVTRASCIDMLRSKGYRVSERPLALEEVRVAAEEGRLNEAFGSGTAAVVSPIGELNIDGKTLVINHNEIGPIARMLYDELTGIQWGRIPDPFHWVEPVCKG